MISFEFPYPPSVNHYWGQCGKRKYITKRGIDFRSSISGLVADKAQETITHEIEAFVTLYPPDKRRRDLDNPMKALLDAMQEAGVYDDDCQIKKLTIEMRNPIKGGKCCVVIVKGETNG
jgi:crossover junction endodeoxyribonuclease RusA